MTCNGWNILYRISEETFNKGIRLFFTVKGDPFYCVICSDPHFIGNNNQPENAIQCNGPCNNWFHTQCITDMYYNYNLEEEENITLKEWYIKNTKDCHTLIDHYKLDDKYKVDTEEYENM